MTTFEWNCERALLEHLMFTLYHYGDSPENPLYDGVLTHFATLASRHPDVTLRVLVYAGAGDCIPVYIRLSDFQGHCLCHDRLERAVWCAKQCRMMRNAIVQHGVMS